MGRNAGPHKYTVQEAQNISLGQAGVAYLSDTSTYTPPTGQVVVAMTFLTDSKFDSADAKVAEDPLRWPTYSDAGPGTNSDAFAGDTMPAGVTIYGRWTAVAFDTGSQVVLYLGS